MRAEVIVAATTYGDELVEVGEKMLDEYTGRVNRPPHERYSTVVDAILGIGGIAVGLFGDRIGIGSDGRLVAAAIGGKHLGRITRNYIEYYAPAPTARTARFSPTIRLVKVTTGQTEAQKEGEKSETAKVKVTAPVMAEIVAF